MDNNVGVDIIRPTRIREKQNSFSGSLLVIFFAAQRVIGLPMAIVILKPYGFSDILFASKTRKANNTRHLPNTTAKQYHSP